MPTIIDMLESIPGVKTDWKEDWKEDAKADFKYEWDAVAGNAASVRPANTVLPVISGTAQVGQVLTVSNGTWTGTPAPTYTYAWLVDGDVVVGETAATYTVDAADEGFAVTAEVTASNGTAPVTVETAPTALVIA